MPTYVYKGGKKVGIRGKTLLNRGDEIELDSLEGIAEPNKLIPKGIWLKKYVKEPIIKKGRKASKEPESTPPAPVAGKEPEKVETAKPTKKGGMTNG